MCGNIKHERNQHLGAWTCIQCCKAWANTLKSHVTFGRPSEYSTREMITYLELLVYDYAIMQIRKINNVIKKMT